MVGQSVRAYSRGEQNPLSPFLIQYADYAVWQRDWLQGETLASQLEYWQQQLHALPVAHSLPLDKARPALQSFNGDVVVSHIDAPVLASLQGFCQSENATLFMGLHAVFAVLLSRYSNEEDIVVGSPSANREQADVSGLIGFFVNSLVLRSDLSGAPSYRSLLRQSKETLLGAYAHQQVPFEQLVEELQPERSLSHSPLFQVMLSLQNNEIGSFELDGMQVDNVDSAGVSAKYDLTLSISEDSNGLSLVWEYNTDLFFGSTIEQLGEHFG